MLIATASACGVEEGLDVWAATDVVSVSTHARHGLRIEGLPHLALVFHDIESAFEGRATGPRVSDVAAVLEFRAGAGARLLLSCAAGLSRSPALALVCHVAAGLSVAEACDLTHTLVPEASPNRRILRLGGELLGIGHDLVDGADHVFGRDRDRFGARGCLTGLRPPPPIANIASREP